MNPQKPTLESAHYPQPQPGESSSAYRAFCYFCDAGPGRTLTQAWRSYCEHCDSAIQQPHAPGKTKRMTRCPGQWTRWSTQFRWLERAIAYDLEIADRRCAKRAEERDALEERRFQFERRSQQDLEDRCKRLATKLHSYELLPATDVIQERVEVIDGKPMRNKSHVKGLRGRDCVAIYRQLRDYLRQATLGVREAVSDDAAEISKADHIFLRSRDQIHSIVKPAAMPEKPPDPPAPVRSAQVEPTESSLTVTLKPHAAPKEAYYSVTLTPDPPKTR